MKKYVSYSELAMWERDREMYHRVYVKGEEIPPNRKMEIGTMIHNVNENFASPWVKQAREFGFHGRDMLNLRKSITKVMKLATPGSTPEAVLTAELDDFTIFVKMDRFHKKDRVLDELKTTDESHWKPWLVHYNFQLDIYALTLYLRMHQFFREIRLHEINYAKGTMHTFQTTRSYRDIHAAKQRILKDVQEMKDAGIWNLRLSRDDRNKLNQGKLL